MQQSKQTWVAYLLWLVAGWIGGHLFYLRRDRQAFLTWCTFGGFFGVSWMRDFVRIPDYVDEANYQDIYWSKGPNNSHSRWRQKSPPFSSTRFLAELMIGYLFGLIIRCALPEEWNQLKLFKLLLIALVVYAIAFGVYTVACIGSEQASLKVAALGASLSLPIFVFNPDNLMLVAICSSLAVNKWGVVWKPILPPGKRPGKLQRFCVLVMCAALYCSLWTSSIYHNAHIETRDGNKIKISVAVRHFFTSPMWEATKKTTWRIWNRLKHNGIQDGWAEFRIALDPEGEYHAYRVLGLSVTATEREISTAYRNMAKRWHPDTQKTEAGKKMAEVEFMRIQQAYETISSIQNRRKEQKNTRPLADEL